MTGSHTHHPHTKPQHNHCCGGHDKPADIHSIHSAYAQNLLKTMQDLRSKVTIPEQRDAVLNEADHLVKTLRPSGPEFHHEPLAVTLKAELDQVQGKLKEAFGSEKTDLIKKEAALQHDIDRALELEAYHWFTAECAKLKH